MPGGSNRGSMGSNRESRSSTIAHGNRGGAARRQSLRDEATAHTAQTVKADHDQFEYDIARQQAAHAVMEGDAAGAKKAMNKVREAKAALENEPLAMAPEQNSADALSSALDAITSDALDTGPGMRPGKRGSVALAEAQRASAAAQFAVKQPHAAGVEMAVEDAE